MRLSTTGSVRSTQTIYRLIRALVHTIFCARVLGHGCMVACAPTTARAQGRLFPAAQIENYSEGSDLLGVIKGKSSLRFLLVGPESLLPFVDNAISRFLSTLAITPDFPEDFHDPSDGSDTIQTQALNRIVMHIISSDTSLTHEVDESYELSIDANSSAIHVTAQTVFGTVRGLETLSQLIDFGWVPSTLLMPSHHRDAEAYTDTDGINLNTNAIGNGIGNANAKVRAAVAPEAWLIVHGLPLFVADAPSYSYRGLLIDTSRHYLPVQLILDNLDAMAMNKLNVLHWHITDSQSWPYSSTTFPELSEKGAYHPKRVYSVDDIQNIVEQARFRGIRVIPEIDMPGHIRSIGKSHPEFLTSCPHPNGPLDPTNPSVYGFVEAIYHDLTQSFPDAFVHVGGDEVNLGCWNSSTSVRQWMATNNVTDLADLYDIFETKLLDIVVRKFNRTPIVWQEVFNLNLTLTNGTIVDVWKGFDTETIIAATDQSYPVIVSGCWYLDHLNQDWRNLYNCNPRAFEGGNQQLVIGGHASMWGEKVDASNFMSRVWPRASAVAERLWSGDVEQMGAAATVTERLESFRCLMVQRGIDASPIRPGHCDREVRYCRNQTSGQNTNSEQSQQPHSRVEIVQEA